MNKETNSSPYKITGDGNLSGAITASVATMGITVKIVNKSNNNTPYYQHPNDAGMDLCAYLTHGNVTIPPFQRVLIPTGVYLGIPNGFELQVRSRSGLALKKGIIVLNAPGTVDSGYIGEVGVILANISNESYVVENGDRIAQMVFSQYTKANLERVETLEETDRGAGGFGSTGVK